MLGDTAAGLSLTNVSRSILPCQRCLVSPCSAVPVSTPSCLLFVLVLFSCRLSVLEKRKVKSYHFTPYFSPTPHSLEFHRRANKECVEGPLYITMQIFTQLQVAGVKLHARNYWRKIRKAEKNNPKKHINSGFILHWFTTRQLIITMQAELFCD